MDVLAGGADTGSTLPRRVGARILRELRGALPPTIFFFVGFNFIVLTTNLLVADCAVATGALAMTSPQLWFMVDSGIGLHVRRHTAARSDCTRVRVATIVS